MGDTRARVLFLDDMKTRHATFREATSNLDIIVDAAWDADEAIQMLKDRPYDQVFLDHDLSEEDIMTEVGEKTSVPTGMAVVDFICMMEKPPMDVFVHSCNEPAAREMARRLRDSNENLKVRQLPFPHLILLIDASRST